MSDSPPAQPSAQPVLDARALPITGARPALFAGHAVGLLSYYETIENQHVGQAKAVLGPNSLRTLRNLNPNQCPSDVFTRFYQSRDLQFAVLARLHALMTRLHCAIMDPGVLDNPIALTPFLMNVDCSDKEAMTNYLIFNLVVIGCEAIQMKHMPESQLPDDHPLILYKGSKIDPIDVE